MCVCFPQMPSHSSVKYTGGKLILTLEGEGSLGQYHIVKTTNLKLLIYVGHSFPHRSPIWGKFMSKLGKGSQGLPRKHLGGRREVTALRLLDWESHLGDCDEEPLLNACTSSSYTAQQSFTSGRWLVQSTLNTRMTKNSLEFIHSKDTKEEKMQFRHGESSYKDSLRRFTFVPCWNYCRQQTPNCTACLVINQPINVHTAEMPKGAGAWDCSPGPLHTPSLGCFHASKS